MLNIMLSLYGIAPIDFAYSSPGIVISSNAIPSTSTRLR